MREIDIDSTGDELSEILFSDIGLCGCGYCCATAGMIYDYLKLAEYMHSGEYVYEEWKAKTEGFIEEYKEILLEFLRYQMDSKGFTEHGSSVGSAWLTDKGKKLIQMIDEIEEVRDEDK